MWKKFLKLDHIDYKIFAFKMMKTNFMLKNWVDTLWNLQKTKPLNFH